MNSERETAVPQSIASRVTSSLVTLTQVELTPDFVDAGSGVSRVRLHLMNYSGLPVAATAVARL